MKTLDLNKMENLNGGRVGECGVEDAALAVGFAALGAALAIWGGPFLLPMAVEAGATAASIVIDCS